MQKPTSSSGTVRKAMGVLDLIASFERPVRFSEVLEKSDFPKGTLYRMVQTLRTEGLLAYDEARQTYSLGIRLMRLAHAAWTQFSLATVAQPHLDRLSRLLGETIHLAQLDNSQVLYVDKRNAASAVEMFSQAGKVGPAYCTGVGKAMLAYLPEAELQPALGQQSYHAFTPLTFTSPDALRAELDVIRQRGFAFDNEEHEPGIICVAVPILSHSNRVIGAISVTSTTSKTSLAEMEKLVPQMRQVTDEIAAAAELWRFPTEQTPLEQLET